MTIKIVVDGLVFHLQPHGGISNMFTETLPRICEKDSDVYMYLILQSRQIIGRKIPEHGRIKKLVIPPIHTFRPQKVWRHVVDPMLNCYYQTQVIKCFAGNITKAIHHSTYFTTMPKWDGPQVVSVYDLIYEKFPHFFPNKLDWEMKKKAQAIQSADWLLCISETTRKDLIEHYQIQENRVRVIYLGYSPIYSQRVEPRTAKIDFPFVLYIGSRGRYKGFEDLLHAYSHWKRNKDIRLIATGSEWGEEEIESIRQLKLEAKIILMPNTSDDVLCDLYNQALAFVYPSYYEGFGIPLLEAMACACPIVASKIPSTLEIAENIPHYFDAGDIDAMIDALEQALAEKNSDRTNQGLRRSQYFSWDDTAREMLAFYREIG